MKRPALLWKLMFIFLIKQYSSWVLVVLWSDSDKVQQGREEAVGDNNEGAHKVVWGSLLRDDIMADLNLIIDVSAVLSQ